MPCCVCGISETCCQIYLAESLRVDMLMRARKEYSAILEIKTACASPTHKDTLSTRERVAILRHAQGDLEGAAKEMQVIFRILTEEVGEDHDSTLKAHSKWVQYQGEVVEKQKER